MPDSYFPLRWESTGDQWWYATPIDWAAANGHCDLVNQLLHIDPNLLIKLTSLRRIRRLETVWDDTDPSNGVAQCRARVARSLLLGCEQQQQQQKQNSLIRAGYGGWLLYTAASAGDVGFVKDLLDRDPVAVFGEGEYGITDILYGAARSENSEVFRLLLGSAIDVMKSFDGDTNNNGGGELGGEGYLWEMMNRAVHAAARGGNVEVLKELLWDCSDVLAYRDAEGSSVLHSASARGQVEVVKYLIATYDIINSIDNQGNTALHVAAYRGYSSVVEVLALTAPPLGATKNNNGDTFLHMAVAGFQIPGFHRIDQQIELMKWLVSNKIISLKDIINVRNSEGRTALHIAVAENVLQSNVVELLMTVPWIDLNVVDVNELTPLDLLKRCPKTATCEILIRQIALAGGNSSCHHDQTAEHALVRHLRTRTQGIGTSPGTSFRFPDAELFSYTGNDNDSDVSCEPPSSSRYSSCSSEPTSPIDSAGRVDFSKGSKISRSPNSGSRRLKFLLQWPRKGDTKVNTMKSSSQKHQNVDGTPTPLRQRFSRSSTLPTNKREVQVRGDFPSPSTKERFAASLMHGVIQATPPPKSGLSTAHYSPWSPFSSVCDSPPSSADQKLKNGHVRSSFFSGPLSGVKSQVDDDKHRRVSSFSKSLMNQYFCFGAQGLAVEEPATTTRASRSCRRLVF